MRLPLIGKNRSSLIGNSGLLWINQAPKYIIQRVKLEQSWRDTQVKTHSLSLLGQPRLAKASSEWTILEPVKVARNLKLAQTSSRVATTLWRRPRAPPTSNHWTRVHLSHKITPLPPIENFSTVIGLSIVVSRAPPARRRLPTRSAALWPSLAAYILPQRA